MIKMIKAVLIDDDGNLREGMKMMINLYAPEIQIVGEADSVKSGTELMETSKPDIAFLDILMNDGTGFDILEKLNEKFGNVNSHIIFITAHEEFAIKAFRFSALDFLLKPVNPEELQSVLKKVSNVIIFFTTKKRERVSP